MKINYREIEVNGYTLRGFFTTPDDGFRDVCVFFHGFTGHKNEHNFMFKQLSEKFAEIGIASLRYDYRGSGDSDGDFSIQNYDTVLEDAEAMLKDAVKLNGGKKVIVLGFSMGGATAGRMTAMHPDLIKKAVLISPAAMLLRSLTRTFENPDLIVDNRYVDLGGYYIDISFRETLKGLDMYSDCDKFDGPVLIVQGTKDLAVFPEDSFGYTKHYPNCTYKTVEGAPHGYSTVKMREELQKYILDFLR